MTGKRRKGLTCHQVFKLVVRWKQKTGNRPTAIAEHLLNNPECAKHYEDKIFTTLATGLLATVLESLYIKILKSKLCKQ